MRRFPYRSNILKARATELSRERGVSEACRDLQISRTHWYDIVNGRAGSFEMVVRVARYLGIDPADVLPSINVPWPDNEKTLAAVRADS